MSSINKIKLPNGTTYDVNDVRISGVDTTPTSGSSNVVTSGGVYTGLSSKAPLASPALTGTPTAPTATAGTNTTQIATTAFVQSASPFEPSTGTGSAKLKNNQAIASGQYSTALGVSYNNTVQTAGADASVVEGAGNITKSGAQAAHAEGVLNVAGRTQEEAVAALTDFPNLGGTTEQKVSKLIGFASHSEGSSTRALGSSSHAEGNSTQALVNATHAEGDSTTASGEAAHSEGYNTTASGKQAHAEGYKTEASANQSHAEGQNTKATSGNAHAEGKYTEATSENAHAEGYYTTANGNASHTEGYYTVANNNVEHAEGQYNVSITNVTQHTVGIGNSSTRKNAHTITTDGKHYIPGIGTYTGTETTLPTGQDLASIMATKAPLASPALTGTPTAPTATAGTNTTQIATTAFVKNAVDSASTSSENLKTEQKTNQEIVFRKTNVDWEAKAAKLTKILGRTEAFNQLVSAALVRSSTTISDVVFTNNNDGSITISGTASADISTSLIAWPYMNNLINGHLYLVRTGKAAPTGVTYKVGGGPFTSETIFTYSGGSTQQYITLEIANGTPVNITLYPQYVDLTLEGLGFTTADQFRALHPLPYYNYNAGVLKNNAATGLESVGFNQWDEEWEVGWLGITTGTPEHAGDAIRAKNFIKALPSTEYCYTTQYTGSAIMYIHYYDADYNHLGEYHYFNSGIFTTPANCAFIRFAIPNLASVTYNHDICINLSNPAINGQYFPYWKRTLALGLNSIACHDENNNAVVVNGLDGVGSSYDEAVVENGMVTKIIKRFAEVDLGDLNWIYTSGANSRMEAIGVTGIKNPANDSTKANIISAKFMTVALSSVYNHYRDKIIAVHDLAPNIWVYDSAYSDAATFKTAMAGVKLRYELATPLTLTVDTPFPALVEVDNLGTEKRLPEDTADNPQAPFECDIQYGINSADIVNSISYLDKKAENIFWATYGTTPYADIKTAMLTNNKIVLMRVQSPDDSETFVLRATYYNDVDQEIFFMGYLYEGQSESASYSICVDENNSWSDYSSYLQSTSYRASSITSSNKTSTSYYPSNNAITSYVSGSFAQIVTGTSSDFGSYVKFVRGNIIISSSSATTYSSTTAKFYEYYMKSIGGYDPIKAASMTKQNRMDELSRYLLTGCSIIRFIPVSSTLNRQELVNFTPTMSSGNLVTFSARNSSAQSTRIVLDISGSTDSAQIITVG